MRLGQLTVRISLAALLMAAAMLAWWTPRVATADVSAVGVVNAPNVAGAVARWTITFSTGTTGPPGSNAINITSDAINITWPQGSVLPATVPASYISVNGTNVSTLLTNASTSVSVRRLSFTSPINVAQNSLVTVVVSELAGITNPPKATTFNVSGAALPAAPPYQIGVSTSQEQTNITGPVGGFTVTPSVSLNVPVATDGGPISDTAITVIEGGQVVVNGVGFTPGQTINVTGSAAVNDAFSTTDSTGAFSFTLIKNSGAVAALIQVRDGAGNRQNSVQTVGLQPDLTATTSGRLQDTLTLTGRNFTTAPPGNVPVGGITIGGVAVGAVNLTTALPSTMVNRDGDGIADDFLINLRIPSNTVPGPQTVAVTDSGGKTASAIITVLTPTVTISPTSGPVGTLVTVVGSNFPAGRAAAVANQVTVGVPIGASNIATDSLGGFTSAFQIPSLGLGSYFVTASIGGPDAGITSNPLGSTTFTVATALSTLSVGPTRGARGARIVITGTGFTANRNVPINNLTIGGLAWNTTALPVNAEGNVLGVALNVPAGTAYGDNTVTATDTAGLSASVTFTATQPTLTIDPTTGSWGNPIAIAGSGWIPNSTVQITRDGVAVTSLTANAAGRISGNYLSTFPAPFTGAQTTTQIGATDGTAAGQNGNVAATQTFTVPAATITLSSSSVTAGDSVTVTGRNFQAVTPLSTLTVGGANILPATPVITSATGSFQINFAAPAVIGTQVVSATVGAFVRQASLDIVAGVSSQPAGVSPGVAFQKLIAADLVQLVSGFNYVTGRYDAFVPGLPGNPLSRLLPNSVIIVTLTSDRTVISSGIRYPVKANVPTPIPLGTLVDITFADTA